MVKVSNLRIRALSVLFLIQNPMLSNLLRPVYAGFCLGEIDQADSDTLSYQKQLGAHEHSIPSQNHSNEPNTT